MTWRIRPSVRRLGFTLIELLVVMVVVGILALLAVPRFRDSTTTAKGTALGERARAVQTAYLGLDAPGRSGFDAAPGTVPQSLKEALGAGHFKGEGGVTLSVVGAGEEDVWLRLEATTATAKLVLGAFDARSGVPHVRSTSTVLVPLSCGAIALLDAIDAAGAADAQGGEGGSGVEGTNSAGGGTGGTGAAEGAGASGSGAERAGGATSIAPPSTSGGDHVTPPETNVTNTRPATTCSARLSPEMLRRCKAAAALGGG